MGPLFTAYDSTSNVNLYEFITNQWMPILFIINFNLSQNSCTNQINQCFQFLKQTMAAIGQWRFNYLDKSASLHFLFNTIFFNKLLRLKLACWQPTYNRLFPQGFDKKIICAITWVGVNILISTCKFSSTLHGYFGQSSNCRPLSWATWHWSKFWHSPPNWRI